MAEVEYRFLEWEHIQDRKIRSEYLAENDSFSELGGRLEWRQALPVLPVRATTRAIIEADGFNRDLAVRFNEIKALERWPIPAIVTFRKIAVVGDEGLLIDIESKTILAGSALGSSITFSHEYAKLILQTRPGSSPFDLMIEEDDFDFDSVAEDGLLLVGSGQSVYGHWLLDFVPRLFMSQVLGLNRGRVYLTSTHPWTQAFLAAFGIAEDRIVLLRESKVTVFEEVKFIPLLKTGYLLDGVNTRLAWDVLASRLTAVAPVTVATTSNRFFVSRKKSIARNLVNEDELISIARARGYTPLFPEDYTVSEQVTLFRSARFIVGPDGSGLHNIIFSRPGCRLGVILFPERGPLWHTAICDAAEHRVLHIEAATDSDGGSRLAAKDFHWLLDTLETG